MQKKLWLAGCRLKNNVFLNLNENLLNIFDKELEKSFFFVKIIIRGHTLLFGGMDSRLRGNDI